KELFQEALIENQLLRETIPQISLTYQQTARNQKLAENLVQQWKEAFGITVKLDPVIVKSAFYQKLFTKDYQLILGSWMADSQDPMVFLAPFQSRSNTANATGWENSNYARLISKAATTEEPEQRHTLLAQAEAILLQEMPLIPLVYCNYTFAKSTRLQNATVSSFGTLRLQ
ncbi:MAG TPA: ABC transporter substrate-binding protein, partial [Chlamydiales bacterium]|nr:ABC transporter substrate-binding protein [Chlamydiales bacterium]